jgi:hypothetical protein
VVPRLLSPLAFAVGLLAGVAVGQRADFLARTQQPDGSWPVVQYGGHPDAVLRVNALLLLVHLGDGSTARSGPRREQVRNSVRWLRRQIDDRGRLSLRADPDWPLDHAIGTFALCEELRLTCYRRGHGRDAVLGAVDALVEQLATARSAPAAELVLWCEFCVQSLRQAARRFPAEGDVVRVVPALLEAVERLTAALDRRPAAPPQTLRDWAAQRLREAHACRFWGDAGLPPEWPEDLRTDPLASFYLLAATFCRGGESFRAAQKVVAEQIVKTQVRQLNAGPDGEDLYGTWDPLGAFGELNGRLGSTATSVLMLLVYYRYVKIAVLGESIDG